MPPPQLPYIELCICCALVKRGRTGLLAYLRTEFKLSNRGASLAINRLMDKKWIERQNLGGRRFAPINRYFIKPTQRTIVLAAIAAWRGHIASLADWTGPTPSGTIKSLSANGHIPRTATLSLLIWLLERGEFTMPEAGAADYSAQHSIGLFLAKEWVEPTGATREYTAAVYRLTDLGEEHAWLALWTIRFVLSHAD